MSLLLLVGKDKREIEKQYNCFIPELRLCQYEGIPTNAIGIYKPFYDNSIRYYMLKEQ